MLNYEKVKAVHQGHVLYEQAAFLKICCMIKYVFDTRNLGLKLEPIRSERIPGILCALVIVTLLEIML